MMIALLHHTKGIKAPAPKPNTDFSPTLSSEDSEVSALGVIPHQIRGSLVSYTMMTPAVPSFSHCTGCAEAVIEAYQKDRNEFIFKVCESIDGSYLENVSGLAQFRSRAAEKLVDAGDWDNDDFDED